MCRNAVLVAFALMLVGLPTSLYSQKEQNIWHFGHYAGIDFNSGTPVALTNNTLWQHEGTATICDSAGNLLFYTDGDTVFDRNHQIMKHGTGLGSHFSSTQAALILPLPCSDTKYYLFSSNISLGGTYYAIVDMSRNNGLGEVWRHTKKTLVSNDLNEKLTAIKHINDLDYWIISHYWFDNSIYAYRLTKDGLDPSPVISQTGSAPTSNNTLPEGGYITGSLQGDRLALAHEYIGYTVVDFDNSTGIASNPISLQSVDWAYTNYGVEFSPDGEKLYFATRDSYTVQEKLFQLDLTAGTVQDIINSSVIIGTLGGAGIGQENAIMMGPDHKIYVNRYTQSWLGVIEYPDSLGTACGFIPNAISLQGKKCALGLHNYVKELYDPPVFQVQVPCAGDSVVFSSYFSAEVDSFFWDFHNTDLGQPRTSKDSVAKHVFANTGSYTVSLIRFYNTGYIDTLDKTVDIIGPPLVDLGEDFTGCEGQQYTLNASQPFASSYSWQDNNDLSAIVVEDPGVYHVTVTNACGTDLDSIHIDMESCDAFIPNIFSPNGDGINDILKVRGPSITSIDFHIYDRYGKEVFNSNSKEIGWDGTYKNKPLNSAVFVYWCRVEFVDGNQRLYKGNITLIK